MLASQSIVVLDQTTGLQQFTKTVLGAGVQRKPHIMEQHILSLVDKELNTVAGDTIRGG